MGGGLAQLCAAYLGSTLPGVAVHVYTFGCPRVGNAAFAAALADPALVAGAHAHMNVEDAVTDVPLGVVPMRADVYAHAGRPVAFAVQEGGVRANHSMAVYCADANRRARLVTPSRAHARAPLR
jgi:predicted lipase